MALHLIKLCVGCDSIADLRQWQRERLAEMRRKGEPARLHHFTRMMPQRRDEIVPGGSLYWVIKGQVRVRQPIIALDARNDEEGRGFCAIRLAAKWVPVQPRRQRPFQGWRYLAAADAPPDLTKGWRAAATEDEPPPGMLAELRSLGLL
jgi:hypothetical protein